MPTWSVEQLRLTVFPSQDLRELETSWWRQLIGSNPATKTVQQGAAVRELGPIRDNYCVLALEVQARRIDWVMSPLIEVSAHPAGFPVFGNIDTALPIFRTLLEPWISTITPIRRMAVGCVLVSPVENKAAGYQELARLLPAVQLDPVNSSDFNYTINRHARSTSAPDLHINRLSQWSVAQLTGIQIQVESPGAPVSVRESGAALSAVRVQLDINTAADRTELLPTDTYVPLFRELISFAEQITARGDIP